MGFLDDLIKIRRSRNLGLNKTAKTVGQISAALLFGILVLQFANPEGLTPGSDQLSYVREISTVTLPRCCSCCSCWCWSAHGPTR